MDLRPKSALLSDDLFLCLAFGSYARRVVFVRASVVSDPHRILGTTSKSHGQKCLSLAECMGIRRRYLHARHLDGYSSQSVFRLTQMMPTAIHSVGE